MDPNVESFYAGVEKAEEGLRQCYGAVIAAGVELAEDRNAQRLRRISEDLGEVRNSVEENGLVS